VLNEGKEMLHLMDRRRAEQARMNDSARAVAVGLIYPAIPAG
jgi:hypothetical protein